MSLVDRNGLPLYVEISGENRPGSMLVEPMLDNITTIKGISRNRPRHRPAIFHTDKAYNNRPVRASLHRRGITTRIPTSALNLKSTSTDTTGSSNTPWPESSLTKTITTCTQLATAITTARKLTKTDH